MITLSIRPHPDGTASVRSNGVELGQCCQDRDGLWHGDRLRHDGDVDTKHGFETLKAAAVWVAGWTGGRGVRRVTQEVKPWDEESGCQRSTV